MSYRYKRSNKRYKVKVPKEKMSFEKKTKMQSVYSLILLGVFVIYSFISSSSLISKCLDTTYTWDMWYGFINNTAGSIKTKSASLVKSYLSFIDSAEKHLGIQEPSAPKVKAEKSTNKTIPDKTISEPKETASTPRAWYVPTAGEITSYFGNRIHPITGKDDFHKGVDIAAPEGQKVTAASEGIVVTTGSDNHSGNFVILNHGDNITSVYAHLSTITVSENDKVKKGTQIGTVGSSGVSTGPHVHFEIRINNESINPLSFVDFKER